MNLTSSIALLVIVLLQPQQVLAAERWQLLWNDEFSGTSLNTSIWSFDVGPGAGFGNNELEYYTNGSNVAVAGGKLVITARKENYKNNNYTSARIKSIRKASWCPGTTFRGSALTAIRFDVRALVPKGQGLWPAAWLMPDGPYYYGEGAYGSWPSSGEMDIMETINNADFVAGTIHYGGNINDTYVDHRQQGGFKWNTPLHTAYHTFSMEWRAAKITWYLDGKPFGSALSKSLNATTGWFSLNRGNAGSKTMSPELFATHPNAPFDQPFFMILNLAVGGSWPGPPSNTTPFPSSMLVDWVRVFGAAVI